MKLDKDTAEAMRRRPACEHCGMWHVGMCRRVKHWRKDSNGSVEYDYRRFWSKRGYIPPEAVLSNES